MFGSGNGSKLGVGDNDIVDVFLRAYHEAFILAQTCTGGDKVPADDVLLHAIEGVGLAVDGGLVEHLGGLLEGGGRHKRGGLEGGTGDTLQDLL